MAEKDKKESFNVFSELTQVLKTLAKKINEQWTAMACFLAVLVTILCLTLLNSADQDKNENHILLTIVLFFSIILILGALIFYKKPEAVNEEPTSPETAEPVDGKEAFVCFYKELDPESLQHKILLYLKDEELKSLPNISDALGINTATIRKSADRLSEKGFLTSKIGEKPKHVSYSLSYPLPK